MYTLVSVCAIYRAVLLFASVEPIVFYPITDHDFHHEFHCKILVCYHSKQILLERKITLSGVVFRLKLFNIYKWIL